MKPNRRQIVRMSETVFGPYDLDGPVQDDMSLLELSYSRQTGNGCYLMRMDPGAVTIPHEHDGVEDFLVIDGDLIESDGTVLGPGDFVSYPPGSHHNSRTEKGCLLFVCEWGKPDNEES